MTFDEFWIVFDNKKAKVKAQKAWDKLTMDEKSLVHHNVQDYVDSTTTNYEARGSGKVFRSHPASYLNGKFFNDEIKKKTKKKNFRKYNTATSEELEQMKRAYAREKIKGKERIKKRKEEGFERPLEGAGARMKNKMGWTGHIKKDWDGIKKVDSEEKD